MPSLRLLRRTFVLKITPAESLAARYVTETRDVVTIGRAADNVVVLPDPDVGDHHAELARGEEHISLRLLDPRGAHVDRARVSDTASAVRIDKGQVIRIGAYAIELLDHEAPGEQERAFLEQIRRNPSDDATRAVYGDWLEEVGRKEEAEFLRAQLALKPLGADDPRFQELSLKIRVLAPLVSLWWRRTIARPALENCREMRFEVQCPKQWDALAPTPSPKERYCASCKRNVYYATNIYEARALAQAGECLVVDLVPPRAPNDLEGDARPPMPLPRPPPPPGFFVPPPPPKKIDPR